MKISIKHFTFPFFLILSFSAQANDFNLDQAFTGLTQQQIQTRFDNIIKEFGNTAAFRHNQSATPQGLLGFSLGLNASQSNIKNTADFKSIGYTDSSLYVPRLYLTKGLPFDIDIGATYSALPGTKINLLGFNLQYAFLDGGLVFPAVSLRAAYTSLSGLDEFTFNNTTFEASISKTFLFFEPYATIGLVQNNASLKVNEVTSISNLLTINDYNKQETKIAIGANLNFLLMQIGLQIDQIGDQNTTTANFGLYF